VQQQHKRLEQLKHRLMRQRLQLQQKVPAQRSSLQRRSLHMTR
jgi:hypothetical protein